MSKIEYSAIIGSLGQTCDRFMKCGYKDPELDKVEFPDIIKNLEKMQVLKGADLYQALDRDTAMLERIKEGSTVPSMAESHSWNIDAAQEVKAVVDIPVMIVGRINDPFLAESALKMGKTDYVIMGRGSLADPYLPNKAKAGKFSLIRQCIGCLQGCIGRLREGPIACLVNPQLGFEYEKISLAEKKKKVGVIGGGPAGIEAARAVAMRGHDVVLYEKRDRLGGAFTVASYTPYKGELATYVAWAKAELAMLGVDVRLCTHYDAKMAKEEQMDALIVATGGISYVPDSITIKGNKVFDAQNMISGELEKPGEKCVVLGGGLVGLEAAVHLGWLGRDVTIIEMLDEIASDVEGGVLPSLLELISKYGINVIVSAKVLEINDGEVICEKDGRKQKDTFDTIATAMGVKPNDLLKDKLVGLADKIYVAGDALSPRKALEATREGFEIGLSV